MPITIPDGALPRLLDWLLKSDSATNENLWCRLFKNNVTPGRNSVTADLLEADFPGYGQKLIVRTDWAGAVQSLGVGVSVLAGGPYVWTPEADGGVIYGCYLVGAVSDDLYAAKRFSEPLEVVNGVPVRCAPTVTLQVLNEG